MPGFELSDRVARSDAAEAENTDGETFVLDPASGRYFTLGDVGGFIWWRLDGRSDLGSIAEAVSDRYEVSTEEAGNDLLEFVAMLGELGLLEPAAVG